MSQIQRFFTVLFFASLLAIAGCSKSDSTSGIENTNDLDKDGIIDIQDPDIDGDGIPNEKDPDMDGDGIPNEKDPDANGDGLDDFGPPGLPGQCPSSADGTYPKCECPTGSVYLPQANDCAAAAGWNPTFEAGCYIGNSNIKNLVDSYIAGDKYTLEACGPIGTWNVSGVTDMKGLFQNTSFNENINNWQVGQVTTFASMFAGAEQFNQPLNKWSINSKNLFGMFQGAKSFNQDIRGWNPPNIGDASYGFLVNGTAFTYDLSVWCLDKVVKANGFAEDSPIADQADKQPRWLGSSCKAELPEVAQCSALEGVEGGQWPNCTCEQGYEFNSTSNSCRLVSNECKSVDINWPDPSVKLGASATVTWNFTPEGCQLADEDALLTLTVQHNTDPNVPTESVSARAIERSAALTLPCFTNTQQSLKYGMTGVDAAFGYETNVSWGTTRSHDAATSCSSQPPEPDDKICGVNKDTFFIFQGPGAYSAVVEQCASYAGPPARRVATLAETQCLCNAGEFSQAKTNFWTSTKDTNGEHWLVDDDSCDTLGTKDPSSAAISPGLLVACVTD
jgi:hypothetical protein